MASCNIVRCCLFQWASIIPLDWGYSVGLVVFPHTTWRYCVCLFNFHVWLKCSLPLPGLSRLREVSLGESFTMKNWLFAVPSTSNTCIMTQSPIISSVSSEHSGSWGRMVVYSDWCLQTVPSHTSYIYKAIFHYLPLLLKFTFLSLYLVFDITHDW